MPRGFHPRFAFLLLLFAAVSIGFTPHPVQAAKVGSVTQAKAASQAPFLSLTLINVYGTDNDGNGIDTFFVRVVNSSGAVLFSTAGQAAISQVVTITIPPATFGPCSPAPSCFIEVFDTAPG